MEGAFVHISFEGGGDPAVLVEVAVPLPASSVGEVVHRIGVDVVEHPLVLLLPGHLPGVEGGDDGLGLGPPELHVVPVFIARLVQHIPEVDDAAMLGVPAPLPHPIKQLQHLPLEPIIASKLRLLEDEPDCLQSVARVDEPALEVGEVKAPVRVRLFDECLVLSIDEGGEDGIDGLVDEGGVVLPLLGKGIADLLGNSEEDHRHGEADRWPGLRVYLGDKGARSVKGAQDLTKHCVSTVAIQLFSCRAAVGSQPEGEERLTEDIATALDDRLPGAGDPEEASPITINTVSLSKIETGLGDCKVLWILFDGTVGGGVDPGGSPLKPHRFVAIKNLTILSKRRDYPPKLLVPAISGPEGQDVLYQLLPELQAKLRCVHRCTLLLVVCTKYTHQTDRLVDNV